MKEETAKSVAERRECPDCGHELPINEDCRNCSNCAMMFRLADENIKETAIRSGTDFAVSGSKAVKGVSPEKIGEENSALSLEMERTRTGLNVKVPAPAENLPAADVLTFVMTKFFKEEIDVFEAVEEAARLGRESRQKEIDDLTKRLAHQVEIAMSALDQRDKVLESQEQGAAAKQEAIVEALKGAKEELKTVLFRLDRFNGPKKAGNDQIIADCQRVLRIGIKAINKIESGRLG